MSGTVESLKKYAEKIFDDLSPEERARYASDEMMRISKEFAAGIDTSSSVEDLDRFIDRYVSTQPYYDYIRYLRALYKLDTDKLGVDVLITHLVGLQREADLLDIVIRSFKIIDILSHESAKLAKLPDERVKGVLFDWSKTISQLEGRRDQALKEIDELKHSDVWEKLGLSQPHEPIYEEGGDPRSHCPFYRSTLCITG
jgi:hypothetical protein